MTARQAFGTVALLLMGVFTAGVEGCKILHGLETERWPTTDGEVVEASTRSYRSGGRRPRTYWEPVVEYRYDVNGVRYLCRQISYYRTSYDTQREAARIASFFPVGGKVKVYYRPSEPGVAVLERGTSKNEIGIFSIGILMAVGAVLFAGSGLGGGSGGRPAASTRTYRSTEFQPDAFLK